MLPSPSELRSREHVVGMTCCRCSNPKPEPKTQSPKLLSNNSVSEPARGLYTGVSQRTLIMEAP